MISVIVPSRRGESATLLYDSLWKQSYQEFEVIMVVDHEGRGAPWARNRGLELARGEHVLFSDTDVSWEPTALASLLHALEQGVKEGPDSDGMRVGYAYGSYYETRHPGWWHHWGRRRVGPIGHRTWDLQALYEHNFVSTMSLVARQHCVPFDESLIRFQDWDLWLHLALHRKIRGTWVGRPLFTTPYRRGLTYGSPLTYEEARTIVRRKHGLDVMVGTRRRSRLTPRRQAPKTKRVPDDIVIGGVPPLL